MRVALQSSGYSAAEIDKAILEHKVPMPERPSPEEFLDMAQPGAIPAPAPRAESTSKKIDYGLTEEDRIYLSNKWGKDFPEED